MRFACESELRAQIKMRFFLRKVDSSETICQSKVDIDNEVICADGLIIPIFLVFVYISFLIMMSTLLKEEALNRKEYMDPFKSVWISGPIFFTTIYLLFVHFGQIIMTRRQELRIKHCIFTYNVYQCLLNLWCVIAMTKEVYSNPHFKAPWGNIPQSDFGGFRISFLVWLHYNNKYVELLDTVWMILRKKNNQVSFLHCYHHILLIWAWYFVCKVESGGDGYFGAAVNSFIHVIMYGYYTLTLLNIPCPWKRWITNCQMLQFSLCLTHSIYVAYKKNLPVELPMVQAFVMVNMLILFGQFYVKSYFSSSRQKSN